MQYFLYLFLFTFILSAQETFAQDASEYGLEEIVVTAQKREDSIQTVPIAITAIDGDVLDNKAVVNLESLQGLVPGAQIGQFANTPHGAVFNIRGMGAIEPDPYAGSAVMVTIDGVPQYFNMTSLVDLFDVERVEVLRGPQGTLFGANTTGGVVNIVTKAPSGEYNGKVQVTAGDWNRFDVKAAADLPINEKLSLRLSGFHHGRDGFITNVYDGSDMGSIDVNSIRATLKYDAGNGFEATWRNEILRSKNGSPYIGMGAYPGEAEYVAPGTIAGPNAGVQYTGYCMPVGSPCKAPDEYYSANSSEQDMSDMNIDASTLEMVWNDTSLGTITSITSFKQFDLHEYTDQDGTVEFLASTDRRTDGDQITQEIRVNSQVSENIDLVYGLYFSEDSYYHSQNFRAQFASPGFSQVTAQDQERSSQAIFAHSFIDLSDRLRLQVGGRYSKEETEMKVDVTHFISLDGVSRYFGDDRLADFGIDFTAQGKDDWTDWSAKVGLDYQISENTLAYGHISRGFKSGGFVGRITIPEDIGPYDPEIVETIELGMKTDLMDNKLRLNVNIFKNDYQDLQLALIYFTKNSLGFDVNGNSILNAADATTQGIEVEFFAAPSPNLRVNGSVTFLEAEYDDFPYTNADGSVTNLSGYRLQNAPEITANFGFDYSWRTGNGEMMLSAIYKYNDEKFNTSLLNTPRSTIQETDLIDANLMWTPDSDDWSVNFWVKNIADERYISSVFEAPGVLAIVNFLPPREYGISFDFNW
ncbi:MAG: TonB-dependent receptor [Alphaproteobacteria bacterium]|jgi:iron complex outermembrane receptor protein|nr:TonB-dependent receptor [Alphaproteobacteria bacterium]